VYMYMYMWCPQGSGYYTRGMVMRVLCADGQRDVIDHSVNDDCELRN